MAMTRRGRCAWDCAAALVVFLGSHQGGQSLAAERPSSAAEKPVDFSRDVRPILATRCYSCHGEKQQESGFRLDRREAALRGGENGVDIVPGKSSKSNLVQRISAADATIRMPPEGQPLNTAAVSVIRHWIDQGATWPADPASVRPASSEHWSLKPLTRPPVPAIIQNDGFFKNAIDAFVAANLARHHLSHSPPADRRTLIRRVYFDLIGLPPTPEAVDSFVADNTPDAYERLVDRLLESPLYGERWARHWIDVVHFAETHGHDEDIPRPNAWPYRDYLIRSFNDDKPYARFVSEQVAGDVLYPEDPQATVALGFLAAGPWDQSSLRNIVDDTIDKKQAQLLDRDDVVMNVMSTFTSTTVHCARCHDHKFDPISQADYYALQAVFAGIDRADREYDPEPQTLARRRSLKQRKHEADSWTCERLHTDTRLQAEIASAETEYLRCRDVWKALRPSGVTTANGSVGKLQADGSILFSGQPRPDKETSTLTFEAEVDGVTAVRLDLLADPLLPKHGPGRNDNGNCHLTEFKLSVAPASGGPSAPVAIASAFADYDQPGYSVATALDGKPETGWGVDPQEGKPHAAIFVLKEPLHQPGRTRLTVVLEQQLGRGHLIGRPRISVTDFAHAESATPTPDGLAAILAIKPSKRTPAQKLVLARSLHDWQVGRELAALPAPHRVYAGSNIFTPDVNFHPAIKPRPIFVLRRGDINQPIRPAGPGALACIPGLECRFKLPVPDDEGARRAALAAWLVDRRNVLVWRSIANRIWHYHFDRGIVDTPNDLGHMGGDPSDVALLDWLAVEFRDGDGAFKKLHRLIVTSGTYRQSSQIDSDRSRIDGENRYLWRMNRQRLDAECIRDAVLQISGKLNLEMGGPSVKQFIEIKGKHSTPDVDYLSFRADDPANFRRSIYRFLFRTLPDPLMESLDCPDGSQFTPVRSESVTSLQALTMLHNRFIVQQSEYTAARLAAVERGLAGRIRLLFKVVLLREPSPSESRRWEAYAARHGLANACRMMLNTNEFVFVN
jgi:hypothetical protein